MASEKQTQAKNAEKQGVKKTENQTVNMTSDGQRMPSTSVQRARLDPGSLTPADVLQLQRTVGNRAAGQIFNQPAPQQPVQRTGTPVVQRNGPEDAQTPADRAKEQFTKNFLAFCTKFDLTADRADAEVLLDNLIAGLAAGEGDMQATPKVTNPSRRDVGRNIVASESEVEPSVPAEDVMEQARKTGRDVFTQDTRPKREETYAKAQQALDMFIAHASIHFTNAIFNRVEQANGNKVPFCFWSGDGAQDMAKAYANPKNGIVLETTMGSWFDDVNLQDLTGSGVYRIDLWGTISELYAKKAAEYQQHLEFVGFVGARADMQQNIFNQLESPTVTQIMTAKYQVTPDITWHVVECQKNAKGWWEGTGNIAFTTKDRSEAVRKVAQLYP